MSGFLERFPNERRSTVSNRFLDPVRKHITDPDRVVQYVITQCGQFNRDIKEMVESFPNEALEYAIDRIAYEALPYSERARLKAERQQQYQNAYMDTQPPTEKQIAYIHKLRGDSLGVPSSRGEASRIIDTLLNPEKDPQS